MFICILAKLPFKKNKTWHVYKFRFSFDSQIKTQASVCPQTTHRDLKSCPFFLEARETSEYADRQSFSTLSNLSSILLFKNTELS